MPQCGADVRLELEPVRVFEEHAEHRRSVQLVEMTHSKKVAQPLIHLLVFASQLIQVRSGLLRNPVERSREQLGFGTEILEDDWLGYADVRRYIGHARLLVTGGGKDGNRRVEDGCAASSGRQAAAARPLELVTVSEERLRTHDGELDRVQARAIVDRDLSKD
jgi:hypothetical protein